MKNTDRKPILSCLNGKEPDREKSAGMLFKRGTGQMCRFSLIFIILGMIPAIDVSAVDFREELEFCMGSPNTDSELCQCVSTSDALQEYLNRQRGNYVRNLESEKRKLADGKEKLLATYPSLSESRISEFCDIADRYVAERNQMAASIRDEGSRDLKQKLTLQGREMRSVQQRLHDDFGSNQNLRNQLRFQYGICRARRDVEAAKTSLSDFDLQIEAGDYPIPHPVFMKVFSQCRVQR